jgi:hypothetical protein
MGTALIVMTGERPQRRDCAITAEALTPAALYRLMTWLSPGYPIGAFSYSSGIEWSVEAGDISDATTLRSWVTVMLAEGGGYCDAVFFAHAYRAAAEMDESALRAASELAIAFAPSKERHLETTAQGRAFLDITAPRPCAASIVSTRLPTGLLRFLLRSPPPAQVRALRSRRRSGAICTRSRPIWFRREYASFRSASPMASACSLRWSLWLRPLPRAR